MRGFNGFQFLPLAEPAASDAIALPDSRFERPELFIPGRIPQGHYEIDWDHPLSKGLVVFILFNAVGVYQPYNLVDGRYVTKRLESTRFVRNGAFFNEGNSSSGTFYRLDAVTLSEPLTVTTQPIFDNNDGPQFQYFLSWGTVGDNQTLNWYLGEESTGNAVRNTLRMTYGTSSQRRVDIDEFWPNQFTGGPMSYVRRNGTLTGSEIYLDGREADWETPTGSGGVPLLNEVTHDLNIGRREDNNGDRFFGGVIPFVAIHSGRDLTAAEVAQFHANPYQVLKPRGAPKTSRIFLPIQSQVSGVVLSNAFASAIADTSFTPNVTVTFN